MKLSTKSQYGLKACFYLAENYGKGRLSIARLGALTNVSEAYLEQLVMPLKREGIIGSQRGASGGYYLLNSPEEVSAGLIVRALEDNLEIVDCLTGSCKEESVCPTCAIWGRLYDGINHILDSITLAQMVEDYEVQMRRNKKE